MYVHYYVCIYVHVSLMERLSEFGWKSICEIREFGMAGIRGYADGVNSEAQFDYPYSATFSPGGNEVREMFFLVREIFFF